MSDRRRTIELFAGPGGWSEGLRLAGFVGAAIGLDNSRDACVTAMRAGHARIECDVSAFPVATFAPGLFGFIASPPCQSFSRAGKQLGTADQQRVMDLVDLYALGRDAGGAEWADARSQLTAEPMRWLVRLAPDWIAMEQVPGVLPLWEHMAKRLIDLGYFTWTGTLNAEEYGVAQTRTRAFLLAARAFLPTAPAPTNQRYRATGPDPASPLPPPVSMAEALGWGLDDRPAWTVTSGGAATGGAEVFGNARCRARLAEVVQRSNYSSGSGAGKRTAAERGRTIRHLAEPSVTITGKVPQWEIRLLADGAAEVRPRPERAIRAATVQGEQGGHRSRVTVREAGVLQSFPANYPWHGSTLGSQYQQVGNAVPPRLAAAVLRQFIGGAA